MDTTSVTASLRVALYFRVSTDDQVEKYGLDLQKGAVEALIKSKGKLTNGSDAMVIAGPQYIYSDEGVSGTTPIDERPAFARLKEDIVMAPEGQRPFDVVAVYKIDRFARRLKILLDIIDFFEKYDIRFVSASESIDTSTPFGKAMLGIIGVIAELEIETTKQRTQAGRAEAYKKGVIMGANAPFGYQKNTEKTLVPFEPETKIVNLIFDKFVKERFPPQQIANYLRENEHVSPDVSAVHYKKRQGVSRKKNDLHFWRQEQVRSILGDEVYIGKYYYHKHENGKRLAKEKWLLSPASHPSVIDLYMFEKAQLLLSRTNYVTNQSNSDDHLYLLSGLIKCDACKQSDSEMVNWSGTKKKLRKGVNAGNYTYSYICEGKKVAKHSTICTALPLPAEPLEDYIVGYTRDLLQNPVAVYNHQMKLKSSQAELKQLRQRREGVKEILNGIPSRVVRLREQHEMTIIDTPTLQKGITELQAKQAMFQNQLADLEEKIGKNDISQEYLISLDLFSQKYRDMLKDLYTNRREIFEILHILMDKIIVYSRSVTQSDVVAGARKKNQVIPVKLEIVLKLPQDIMNQLPEEVKLPREIGFGVKSADL